MRTWFQQSFPTRGEWDFSLRLLLRFRCQVAATLEEAQGVRPRCGAKVGMASSAALLLVIVDLRLERYLKPFSFEAFVSFVLLGRHQNARVYQARCHSQGPSSFTRQPAQHQPRGNGCSVSNCDSSICESNWNIFGTFHPGPYISSWDFAMLPAQHSAMYMSPLSLTSRHGWRQQRC